MEQSQQAFNEVCELVFVVIRTISPQLELGAHSVKPY